jgi:hypothetical protein
MKVAVPVVNPLGQIAVFPLLLSEQWLAAAQENGFDVPLKKALWISVRPRTTPAERSEISCLAVFIRHSWSKSTTRDEGSRVAVDCSGRERSCPDIYSVSCHGGNMSSNTMSGAGISMVPRGIWCSSMLLTGQMGIVTRHLRFQNRDEGF